MNCKRYPAWRLNPAPEARRSGPLPPGQGLRHHGFTCNRPGTAPPAEAGTTGTPHLPADRDLHARTGSLNRFRYGQPVHRAAMSALAGGMSWMMLPRAGAFTQNSPQLSRFSPATGPTPDEPALKIPGSRTSTEGPCSDVRLRIASAMWWSPGSPLYGTPSRSNARQSHRSSARAGRQTDLGARSAWPTNFAR